MSPWIKGCTGRRVCPNKPSNRDPRRIPTARYHAEACCEHGRCPWTSRGSVTTALHEAQAAWLHDGMMLGGDLSSTQKWTRKISPDLNLERDIHFKRDVFSRGRGTTKSIASRRSQLFSSVPSASFRYAAGLRGVFLFVSFFSSSGSAFVFPWGQTFLSPFRDPGSGVNP